MRNVVNYIPYKNTNGAIEVYIQRRTLDAPVRPGLLGLFGGGIKENETDLHALYREVLGELNYIPGSPVLLGIYEDEVPTNKKVYIEKVDPSFEDTVIVSEGQYGIFMSRFQIEATPDITPMEKNILFDLIKKVSR
jgi:8-oxo-dGTP pyrophosphatase MutT (NUDIX family)